MSLGRHWLLYGVQRLVPVALVLAMGAPVQAVEPPPSYGVWTQVATENSGSWTGYSARLQVRYGASGVAFWPGGLLTDGTFVQSGLIQPGPLNDCTYVFAWAAPAGSAHPHEEAKMPVVQTCVHNARVGSWYTFQLFRSGATWTFRYQDPAGAWHTQGRFTDKASLYTVNVTVERWTAIASSFYTQVATNFMVRRGTTWAYVPTAYGSGAGCDMEKVTSPRAGSVTFVYGPAACRLYRRLW